VTGIPRAILAIDAGAATTAIAVIGRPADRWRLLGSMAAPASADPDELAALLAARIAAADRELAATVDLGPAGIDDLPRLEARSAPPATLAVLAGSPRSMASSRRLEQTAARLRRARRPARMTTSRPEVSAHGRTAEPRADERQTRRHCRARGGGGRRRAAVMWPADTDRASWAEGLGEALDGVAERVLQAPPLGARSGPDEVLRDILEGLLPEARDTRHTAVRTLVSLADVLDRRIELLEIGFDGGLRAVASRKSLTRLSAQARSAEGRSRPVG
jgi:hypothetical protein